MRKSRYSDNQIMAIIKQNEDGASVADLCRDKIRKEAIEKNVWSASCLHS